MSRPFDAVAARNLADPAALARHDAAVYALRTARDRAAAAVPDFEALCDRAAAIKNHTLDSLDTYLERFEARARQLGAVVHYAASAAAQNRLIEQLLADRDIARVVKSKSMLSEECRLNAHLESRGIEVVDTDLGERIVQLAGEMPSHIVVPAIHRRREEVGDLFHEHMGTPAGESDPERLMQRARADLRERFLDAQAAITGVNFAIAETGSLVLVTNEGNADLATSLAPLHIACMGIEKLIPLLDDLPVFLRLLARSATGQALSAYTTLITGPRPGGELHIIIVDNGRTDLLASPTHRSALRCIRCGACLNTCPVYRRSGGHAYGIPIAGPIGSVLAPALPLGDQRHQLAFASSLCGSCSAVCPVRIDLHGLLLAWRHQAPALPIRLRAGTWLAGRILQRPTLYRIAGRALRAAWPLLRRRWPGNPAKGWLAVRELPSHPGSSFARRFAKRAKKSPQRKPSDG